MTLVVISPEDLERAGSVLDHAAGEYRDLAGELALPICAISPNCDLSSPVPVQRETMISYVRDCIKLASDVGAPLCKIFAAWRGITLRNGLATYHETYGYDQYGFWKGDRREFVVGSLRELTKVAEDHGIVLALENHIDLTADEMVEVVGSLDSPWLGVCLDTGNNLRLHEDPVVVAEKLAPFARATHIKDLGTRRGDPVQGSGRAR